MNDGSLYKSKRTAKSLWQQYRIYRDRLHGLNGTGCRIRMIR
jgi:hypothetical protein